MTGGHRFGNLNIFYVDTMIFGGARKMFTFNKFSDKIALRDKRRR